MLWICLALVPFAFLVSTWLAAASRRAAERWALVDSAGAEAHKPAGSAVPNVGGIAIFWTVAGPIAGLLLMAWAVPAEAWQRLSPAFATHLPGLRDHAPTGLVLILALGLLHVVGLIDDRRALGPGPKLAAQLLAAIAMVWLGQTRIGTFLDTAMPAGLWVSGAISVLWLVAITNAFNFLDNMDGLAGGIAAIVAGLYLAATLIGGQWFVAGASALLIGAALGLLVFNFPPAKLYMGDAGSLVIGFTVAVISVRTTYIDAETALPRNWYGLMMPVLVLAVPLYDLLSVTIIRLTHGRSPFTGDHNHFSHRLVRLGLSRRRAVGVIWLCALATGISGVMLARLAPWQAALAAAQSAAVIAVLAALERGVARQRERAADERQ